MNSEELKKILEVLDQEDTSATKSNFWKLVPGLTVIGALPVLLFLGGMIAFLFKVLASTACKNLTLLGVTGIVVCVIIVVGWGWVILKKEQLKNEIVKEEHKNKFEMQKILVNAWQVMDKSQDSSLDDILSKIFGAFGVLHDEMDQLNRKVKINNSAEKLEKIEQQLSTTKGNVDYKEQYEKLINTFYKLLDKKLELD